MHIRHLFLAGLVSLSSMIAAAGTIDAYQFADKNIEGRYHALVAELRCPQCLNTNLAGSDAMIAQDLRREVAEQVNAGRSDAEILEFMYQRYGDFILYRPRLTAGTVVLWTAPGLLLLMGGIWVFRVARGHKREHASLSAEDQARLADLLER
jgi:cytochrome c-type biogenesis protein CcmH